MQSLHGKKDKNGNLILDETGKKIPVDFVNTGNNHHVAIYRKPVLDKTGQEMLDNEGNPVYELDEVVVSFFEAVTRVNLGLLVIDKNYKKVRAGSLCSRCNRTSILCSLMRKPDLTRKKWIC